MKLYLLKDKVSGNIISTRTAENLDVFKRYLVSNRIDLVNANNHSSLRLLKDCEVYEVSILSAEEISNPVYKDDLILWGDCNYSDNGITSKKVLDIETFFNEFDKKSGSLEDKI